MSKSTFKYGLRNEHRDRWKSLKNKGNSRSKSEDLEFQVLNFQKEAGLKEPYGVRVDKQTILEALFGPNPYTKFEETENSEKWDSVVLNVGYEEDDKKATNSDGVTSRIRFFKGNQEITDILPTGGGGDGRSSNPTPPPN